eukprot:c2573_g1_i1.p1 GENE.c2573_g1_i1~~c2573_g1_i1.p1  ORF type:complete len:364 (-),score=81.87 c2573_g1_i1:4-1095(-)
MGNCFANCLTSSVLSILLCRHGCQIESVTKSLAYFPPTPPTYKLILTDGEKYKFQLVDTHLGAWADAVKAAQKAEVFRLRTNRGGTIPAVLFRYSNPTQAPNTTTANDSNGDTTILFSHSNAMDLGIVVDLMHKLSLLLKVNMFAYEYTGYGVSSGGSGPSERDTYADATAAFEKLLELGIPASSIICYGQSIGSGPSCYIASKHNVRGLILHGPLASALDVVSQPGCCRPASLFSCCNVYPNIKRITQVTCPTLVMHGHADEVIAFNNGKRLHEACRGNAKYPPYFVPGAGHNNLLEIDPEGFITALRDFVSYSQSQAPATPSTAPKPSPLPSTQVHNQATMTLAQNQPQPQRAPSKPRPDV